MTIAYDGFRGSNTTKSAGTTLALTIAGADIPAGSLVIVRAATDNSGTTTGETTDHSISDSGGNTWTRIKEHTYSPGGSANDGATVSMWRSILATGLTSGSSTITLTTPSVDTRTVAAEEFTGTNLTFESANSVAQTTDPREVTLGSLTSREHLLVALSGVEGTSVFVSEDADYSSFATNVVQTSGGSAASNITQWGGYRVATLTTDTRSSDANAARDGCDILGAFYEGSGGTQYNQSAAGTLTSAGDIAKQTGKPLAGTLTSAGALIKRADKLLAGTLTTAGNLAKQANKALAGTLTSAGALTASKVSLISLEGTLTSAGTLAKSTNKALGGALTSSGVLIRDARKALDGTLTSAGSLVKQAGKSLSGILTSSGTVAGIKTALVSLAGTLTSSGTLAKQAGKGLAGTLASSGVLSRMTSKSLEGTLTSAGNLVKQTLKVLAGVLSSLGSLATQHNQPGAVTGLIRLTAQKRSMDLSAGSRTTRLTVPADHSDLKV